MTTSSRSTRNRLAVLPVVFATLAAHAASGPTEAAVARFYGAVSVAELTQANDAMGTASAAALLAHADRAELEANRNKANDLLLQALESPRGDETLLILNVLAARPLSLAHHARWMKALARLGDDREPASLLRDTANFFLARAAFDMGDVSLAKRALARRPGRLTFRVVGSFDNDQGKGFDESYGPEKDDRPGEKYTTRGRTVGWRAQAVLNEFGELDFGASMSPRDSSVAYAAAEFTSGPAPLQLVATAHDAIKVFVDGSLVFASSEVKSYAVDNIVVPLKLAPGRHRLLVKSCNQSGDWTVEARVVEAGASAVATAGTPESLLEWRTASLRGEVRRAAATAVWAQETLGGLHAVKAADAWLVKAPNSIPARMALVRALWSNGERGRAADLLMSLDRQVGDQLYGVRNHRGYFLLQDGLKQKAVEISRGLEQAAPNLASVIELKIEIARAEDWTADEVRLRRALLEQIPSIGARLDYADALMRQGRRAQAIEQWNSVRKLRPGQQRVADVLSQRLLSDGELREADRVVESILEYRPTSLSSWFRRAEIARRAGDYASAERFLNRVLELCPESGEALVKLSALSDEQGRREEAIARFRRALEVDPDNERVLTRLDYLSPEKKQPWTDDVPSDAAIEAAVNEARALKPIAGADSARVLDHEVVSVSGDGSASGIVTEVSRAFNEHGRDALTRAPMMASGRVRVLQAYALDPAGNRTDPQQRGRDVLFRNLKVGSITVLQYRYDASPAGLFARYWTSSWGFQHLADQASVAQYIVWLPKAVNLHEWRTGAVDRSEEMRGELRRISWKSVNMPPLVAEPGMPNTRELAANLMLSTVTDWSTWLSWERALLDGAFRDSPELNAVAQRIDQVAKTPQEKVERIHEFVMQEIRYQQDYETFVAGWKPHPASMVLERKYGDCKDKAVLFITLAKKLGIDAHFALVRTRDQGPVVQDVPTLQFNHAITFIPKQPGIERDHFYDATTDMLDLGAVRGDDVGTTSLVFSPTASDLTWRPIEYQTPDVNSTTVALKLALDPDARLTGRMVWSGVGGPGSIIRRAARNKEGMVQLVQRVASETLSGAATSDVRANEVLDLRSPAELEASIESSTAIFKEGNSLRLKVPVLWRSKGLFGLKTRRHPLVLGEPQKTSARTEISLPEGVTISKLPAPMLKSSDCLVFERTVQKTPTSVRIDQTMSTTCGRISPEAYPVARAFSEEIDRALNEELVLDAKKPLKKQKAK